MAFDLFDDFLNGARLLDWLDRVMQAIDPWTAWMPWMLALLHFLAVGGKMLGNWSDNASVVAGLDRIQIFCVQNGEHVADFNQSTYNAGLSMSLSRVSQFIDEPTGWSKKRWQCDGRHHDRSRFRRIRRVRVFQPSSRMSAFAIWLQVLTTCSATESLVRSFNLNCEDPS